MEGLHSGWTVAACPPGCSWVSLSLAVGFFFTSLILFPSFGDQPESLEPPNILQLFYTFK